jgi:hypothetical protein
MLLESGDVKDYSPGELLFKEGDNPTIDIVPEDRNRHKANVRTYVEHGGAGTDKRLEDPYIIMFEDALLTRCIETPRPWRKVHVDAEVRKRTGEPGAASV